MPRYAQLVMGPAGSGKSTYCNTVVNHCATLRRSVQVVNLDPAAEQFSYPVMADIRELISVDDVMEDEALRFGPNGALIFCMEYFAQNFDWLQQELDDLEDDYILFDCPGQIELYTHIPVMRDLVSKLHDWNFYVCGVFLVDAQFMIEPAKFIAGVFAALSAMVTLEIPHVNVMTKLDLLNKKANKHLARYLEPDLGRLLNDDLQGGHHSSRYDKLNKAIANVVDDYSLVKFMPLDPTNEDSINDVVLQIDSAIQYGEDFEPKEPKEIEEDESNELHDFFD